MHDAMAYRFPPRGLMLAASLSLCASCDEARKTLALESNAGLPLLKTQAAKQGLEDATNEWAYVPMPAADGPKLAAVSLVAPIYPKPDHSADAIGYLRLGARVARSKEPVSRRDCEGGW